jgi:hypothetical protein
MRLQLILPQVNATELGKVLVCPNKDCQGRHFVHHQEVDTPLKDTKYRLSRIRYRGPSPNGVACRSCWATQDSVGFLVTP